VCDAASETKLIAQTLMDTPGRMAPLLVLRPILFEDLINDRRERIKLGTHS